VSGGAPAGSSWYEEAFGEDYLLVYAHRDEAEAERATAFAARALGLSPPARVLDLGCGAGRHARALAERGFRVVGCDRSATLLARFPRSPRSLAAVRADLRDLPFRAETFEAAASFFHSFGYFEREEDDVLLLREAARVLVRGGRLFLDLHNPERVRRDLVREDTLERGGVVVRSRRRLEGRLVVKEVRIEEPGALPRGWTEVVRLYGRDEVARALRAGALDLLDVWGDFDGSPLRPDSPRLVAAARKR
jgi:SAM-dependent methyltransferase